MTYVTVGAVAAMLVMALLTAFALNARAEAERQRGEAEGLVEFMLTDLRDKLREVGRLDIHATVNRRAIAYYSAQGDLRKLPDESLERRARVLHAMGEDDETAGLRANALASFREAHAATAEVLARRPGDAKAIFAHAQSEYWLGYLAYLNKDWPRAEVHWRGYKGLADRLVRVDPANPTSLREQGYATGNLCTLEVERNGVPRLALEACAAAVLAMKQVRRIEPGVKADRDLANRHAWLGDAWRSAGNHDRALAEYRLQHALLKPLAERYPEDFDLQDQWMRAQFTFGELLKNRRELKEAQAWLTGAAATAAMLRERDPENESWRSFEGKIEKSLT